MDYLEPIELVTRSIKAISSPSDYSLLRALESVLGTDEDRKQPDLDERSSVSDVSSRIARLNVAATNDGSVTEQLQLCSLCRGKAGDDWREYGIHELEKLDVFGKMSRLFGKLTTSHIQKHASHCAICRLFARCTMGGGISEDGLWKATAGDLHAPYEFGAVDDKHKYSLTLELGDAVPRISVLDKPEKEQTPEGSWLLGPLKRQKFTIFCINDQTEKGALGPHRVTDEINFSVVKRRLDFCETQHGSECMAVPSRDSDSEVEFWTFDIVDRCLRLTTPRDKFIALSYALGRIQVAPFAASTEDFMGLVDGRSKVQAETLEALPLTIKDAMLAVAKMDERLIWVDALCIPPEPQLRVQQIQQMDQIYSAAYCTITVATGTSAKCPLPGVRPGTRRVNQVRERITGKVTLAAALHSPHELVETAVSSSRAWCFQERVLSRRQLFFTDSGLIWHCDMMQCDEDAPWDMKEVHRPADFSKNRLRDEKIRLDGSSQFILSKVQERSSLSCPTPQHEQLGLIPTKVYSQCVREYTGRNMTFASDILNAFSGLAHRISLHLDTSLFYGLPEKYFIQALLWDIHRYHKGHYHGEWRRRACSELDLPSWCWAAWHGPLTYDESGAHPPFSDYVYLRQLVLWYHRDDDQLRPLLAAPIVSQYSEDHLDPLPVFQLYTWRDDYSIKGQPSDLYLVSSNHILPQLLRFPSSHIYTFGFCLPILSLIRRETTCDSLINVITTIPEESGASRQAKPGMATIHDAQHRAVGYVSLTDGSRMYDATKLEMLLMAEQHQVTYLQKREMITDKVTKYLFLVLEWVDEDRIVAERAGMAKIDQTWGCEHWWSEGPTLKDVVLR